MYYVALVAVVDSTQNLFDYFCSFMFTKISLLGNLVEQLSSIA